MKTSTYLLTVLLLLGTGLHAQQAVVDDPVLIRKINALRAVWQDVESNPVGSDKRNKYLGEFLDKSAPVLENTSDKHPAVGGLWTLRAIAGYELNQPSVAWEAGQKMIALGLDKNPNELYQKTLAMLERKGWLDAELGEKFKAQRAMEEKFKGGKNISASIGMEMVWIPKDGQNGGYWVGKYEVTQAEYEKVIGSNPSHFKGERRPVEQVSWNDATEFCKLLTESERKAGRIPDGWSYTLPSENQWQYTAADATINQAVWKRNVEQGTVDVGTLKANKFGLYDTLGNVWEWCQDWYDNEQKYRVLRGGSWGNDNPVSVSVSFRDVSTPESRINFFGFSLCVGDWRVVLVTVTAGLPFVL